MSIMKLATYFVLLGALAGAQSPPISFDAASIKVNNSGERRTSIRSLPGGRVEGTNRTLKLLIQWAFDLLPVQIAGGPAWIESDRFDISATANAAVTPEQMHAMMRTLLADRFKLASHAETQQLPIYAMRLARADGRL